MEKKPKLFFSMFLLKNYITNRIMKKMMKKSSKKHILVLIAINYNG